MYYTYKQAKQSLAKTLSLAVAGLAIFSASAQAGIVGTGSAASFGSFFTTAELSNNSLNFNPNPGYATVSSTAGDLTGFTAAEIESVITFSPTTTTNNPFIDFGFFADTPLLNGGSPGSSLIDEQFAFFLEDASFQLGEINGFLSVEVGLNGYFEGDNGIQTAGSGVITLQSTAHTQAQAQALLDGGGTISGMTFSGATVAVSPVPEPSTYAMFGIAFIGLGIVSYRKRRVA